MGRNSSTWKRIEKEIGRMYGGDRIPITGRTRGSAADCTSAYPLGIEVKHRKAVANYITEGMDQAVASCHGDDTPVVFIHKKGTPTDESYAVMRIKDHIAWCAIVHGDGEHDRSDGDS
jgi:hypothetical protein